MCCSQLALHRWWYASRCVVCSLVKVLLIGGQVLCRQCLNHIDVASLKTIEVARITLGLIGVMDRLSLNELLDRL